MTEKKSASHIVLTSHPHHVYNYSQINWGDKDPKVRGPIVATLSNKNERNSIGTHSGSYSVYRALALASGSLPKDHRSDLSMTNPISEIGPFPSWEDPKKIVSLDPWGAKVAQIFEDEICQELDIKPSIAITKARLQIEEVQRALREGKLKADGKILHDNGDISVTKAAIEPVWYLPGLAQRFEIDEVDLRKALFEETGGMFPELVTRFDLKVFLPPIGSTSVYIMGDVNLLGSDNVSITCRVHDECNGSDVFGSDICTCRPYLIHGIEESLKKAQEGGVGLVIYFRKEGRALGEVTKFLVYNARKRQEGGDSAEKYFYRTECVAGVQDMRFQELMPDVLHWLGIKTLDRFISMSDMKYQAVVNSGITVKERVEIPQDLIPDDASVEIEAKKAAGYYSPEGHESDLDKIKGRDFDDE